MMMGTLLIVILLAIIILALKDEPKGIGWSEDNRDRLIKFSKDLKDLEDKS